MTNPKKETMPNFNSKTKKDNHLPSYKREELIYDLQDINSTQTLILLILNTYADSLGQNCYPSTTTIATKAKLSRKSVSENIRELVDKGYLIKTERHGKSGQQTSNLYQIIFAKMPNNTQLKGVTESDGGVTQGYRGCHLRLQGVSPTVTGGCNSGLHDQTHIDQTQLDQPPLSPQAENQEPEKERGSVKTDPEKTAPSEPTEERTKPTDTSLSLEGKATVSGTVQQPSLEDHYSAPQSVKNTSRQGKKMLGNQGIVKAEIESLSPDYALFVKKQIDYLAATSYYLENKIKVTERTVLQRYAKLLSAYSEPTQRELINLRENIQADIEKHGLNEEIQKELPLAPKIGDNAMLYLYHELYLKQGFEAVKSWILRKANRGEHGTDPSANFKAFEQFRMEQEGC